jgi:mono/diheme cytochrome c family protein
LGGACTRESRTLAADQPQSAPHGPDDPRGPRYTANFYQVAQGGRYFGWYGCGACHTPGAHGAASLVNGSGRALSELYAAIAAHRAQTMGLDGGRIPSEQTWQIAAFLRDLARQQPAHNRRSAADQLGEPQGNQWPGPIR